MSATFLQIVELFFHFYLFSFARSHSTMEELEKHDGDVAHIIHVALERVQDVQNGDGVDVVAVRV